MKTIRTLSIATLICLNAACAFAENKSSAADPRQVAITVGRLLEQGHYSRQRLDARLSRKVLDAYLLDGEGKLKDPLPPGIHPLLPRGSQINPTEEPSD